MEQKAEELEERLDAILINSVPELRWNISVTICPECRNPILYHYDFNITGVPGHISEDTLSYITSMVVGIAREIYNIDIKVVKKYEI